MRISDWSSDVCSSDLFEHCLGSNGGTTLDAFAPEMLAEYRRCWRDPAMITASCSDYRAGSTIDLEHDAADITTKVTCPLLALWAEHGIMTPLFDIPAEWRKPRSEERRVGKEGVSPCCSRWSPVH